MEKQERLKRLDEIIAYCRSEVERELDDYARDLLLEAVRHVQTVRDFDALMGSSQEMSEMEESPPSPADTLRHRQGPPTRTL